MKGRVISIVEVPFDDNRLISDYELGLLLDLLNDKIQKGEGDQLSYFNVWTKLQRKDNK